MNSINRLINIFLLITVILAVNPPGSIASGNSQITNSKLDSVKNIILSNGLNEKNFSLYKYYLLNGTPEVEKELNFVASLPESNKQKFLLGVIYKKKGKFKKEFEILHSILKSIPENLDYYKELIWSGKIQNKLNAIKDEINNTGNQNKFYDYAKALINYNKGNYKAAAKIFKKLIDSGLKNSFVYFWNAYSLRGLGNYDEALKQLKLAEKVIHNKNQLSKYLNAEGSLYYLSGNYKKAKSLYNQAMTDAKIHNNNIELTKSLINLAIISDENGDVTSARKLFFKALAITDKVNSIELQALVHSELGVSYTFDNRLVDAQLHYNKSLELFAKLKDNNRLATLYANLGQIYSQISNYKFALETFEKGLKAAGENKRSKILNLTGIADVYANLSNYSKALIYYNKAKKLSTEIKEISTQAEIEEGLGILEFNLGIPGKALQYFTNAKKLSASLNNSFFKAELFHKFGVTYYSLGNSDSAEQYLKAANNLSIANGDIYNQLLVELDLTDVYLNKNKLSAANSLLKNIKAVCTQYELKHLLAKHSLLTAELNKQKGNIYSAEKYFRKAIDLSKETHELNNLIEANYQLGILYLDKGNIEKAKNYLVKAKQFLENSSKFLIDKPEIQIAYFSSFNKIYETLAELYLSENENELAFETVNAQRSRNTVQNLTNLKIISVIKDKEQLKKLYNLDWMIHSGIYSTPEIDSLKSELKILRQKLVSENPSIKNFLELNKNRTLKEIQAGLDSADHLISFFTNDKFTEIFHLTKNSFRTKKIKISRNAISSLIKNISPFYEDRKTQKEIYFNQDLFSFNSKASNKLYKLLIEPVLKNVKSNRNIIFSLPPDMLKIPMEFLVTNYNNTDSPYNYKNVNYLIEKFNISYAPSANAYLALQEKESSQKSSSLLIGDPEIVNAKFVYSIRGSLLEDKEMLRDINLATLDFSKEEIEGIGNILKNTEVFLSEKATESNFKKYAPESSIIHLSTHSFLYNNQPLIVFSNNGNTPNDGLLERGEIAQLNLNADMVVLSSCKSGLGELDKSEGVLGMQKSFIDAGAKSVVVSLWDVNDKYTSILMKYFYKFLSDGNNKSKALRLAKVQFIKNQSPNPYYWAAFVLTGNTKKINLEKNDFKHFIYTFIAYLLIFISLLYYIKKKTLFSS